MLDLFPRLFATTKAHTYFATTLGGFTDSRDNFKFFDGDESPTAETIFISVDIDAGGQDQRSGWQTQIATFNVTGEDTDTATLWTIANKLWDIYKGNGVFSDGTQYLTVGDAMFGQGRNPVTNHRVVSVAITFGLAE